MMWTSIQEDILSVNSRINHPQFNEMVLQVIQWYLHSRKGFTLASIRDFTTYDFINMECSDHQNSVCGEFVGYRDWYLTHMEYKLMMFYLKEVRWNRMNSYLRTVDSVHHMTQLFFDVCDEIVIEIMAQTISQLPKHVTTMTDFLSVLIKYNIWSAPSPIRPMSMARRTSRSGIHSTSANPTSSDIRQHPNLRHAIYERCATQSWQGMDVQVRCGNRGRGVVTTQKFAKGQILMDYHAKVRVICVI